MSNLNHDKINRAIHDCLDRCYQTTDFLPKIAAFIHELKSAPHWTYREIHAVELAVLAILQNLIRGPIYPGDATNQPASDQSRGAKATRLSGA